MPRNTVDAVVQGHTHVFSHHFIDGIPIAGTINNGYYFNIIYLTFRHGKIADKYIEGPIPVCEKVFKHDRTCAPIDGKRLSKAGPLVEWKFHGRIVKAHPQLKTSMYGKWWPLMTPYLAKIADSEVYLPIDYFR